jgi:hypothetical protein
LFSKVENAANLKPLKCDRCGVRINTLKIKHLKDNLSKCNTFKRMYKKDDINIPDWIYSKSAKSGVGSISSSTGSNQSCITAHFNKTLSKSELDKLYYYLLYFYLSGTSFSHLEEPFLLKAYEVLRPGTSGPTRQSLTGSLLDFYYECVLGEVTTYLKKFPKTQYACLTNDAATNVNGSDVENYMVVVGGKSLLLQQENTNGVSHSTEWIRKCILESMTLVQENMHVTVAGVCTKNTDTNKNAWTAVKED